MPIGNLRVTAEGYTAPIVIFNSTRLPIASPAYFSNYPIGSLGWTQSPDTQQGSGVDILSAVLHSARFPIVSPSGTESETLGASTRYVDGGYVENSGAEAVLQLLNNASENTRKHIVPLVIESVPSAPHSGQPDHKTDKERDIMTALGAVLTVRESRASRAEETLLAMNKSRPGFLMTLDYLGSNCISRVPPTAQDMDIARSLGAPPLGWTLSDRSIYAIGSIALGHSACMLKPAVGLLAPNTMATKK
jgi:hypothetical protein